MKCQSKIDVSINTNGKEECLLIKGNIYKCEYGLNWTPKSPYYIYIVQCEDGKLRKYNIEHFVDIKEVRQEKLKYLGI